MPFTTMGMGKEKITCVLDRLNNAGAGRIATSLSLQVAGECFSILG